MDKIILLIIITANLLVFGEQFINYLSWKHKHNTKESFDYFLIEISKFQNKAYFLLAVDFLGILYGITRIVLTLN